MYKILHAPLKFYFRRNDINCHLVYIFRDLTGEEYIHKETRDIFHTSLKDVKWSSIEISHDIFNPDITYEKSIFPASTSMSQVFTELICLY